MTVSELEGAKGWARQIARETHGWGVHRKFWSAYKANRRVYRQEGVPLAESIHNAATWARMDAWMSNPAFVDVDLGEPDDRWF